VQDTFLKAYRALLSFQEPRFTCMRVMPISLQWRVRAPSSSKSWLLRRVLQ
jgi:hypothetical protein